MAFTETKNDLLKDLLINESSIFKPLETMSAGETKFLKDLRINLKNTLTSENLNPKEAYLIALSVSANEKNKFLSEGFTKKAIESGATDAEIAETYACTAMLSSNNVLYRFKHFIKESNPNYKSFSAGIKMNVMMNPVLGKELFELVSLVVSAVNGCESCVNSHEHSVKNLGSTEARIYDAVKLGSIIKGLCTVIY